MDEGHSTLVLRRRLSSSRIAAASSWVIPMTRALSGDVRRARLAIHSWCSLEVFCIVATPGCRKPQDRTVEATRLEMLEETFGTVCWISMPRELKYFRITFFVRGFINLTEIADRRTATSSESISFHLGEPLRARRTFISVKGPEFLSKWVGESEKR